MYDLSIAEEELKNKVAMDFFGDFDTTERFNNIDFVVAPKTQLTQINQYYLWAEAKRGNKSDIIESFIQLILTIGKAKLQNFYIPPQFLGAFDAEKFAFVEFSEVAHIFSQNDFNWSVTPSNYDSKEFKLLYRFVGDTLKSKNLCFRFSTQGNELREFIKLNFTLSAFSANTQKIQITKNNFLNIYLEWLNRVKPSISINWEVAKVDNILDSDFYLADLLSRNNSTAEIYQNLRILLQSNYYEVKLETIGKYLNFTKFSFKDEQQAHKNFWSIYERPPKEEFWDYIIERRDLLVPQDIRERKGAYFTPQIWVQKAQEYLAESLGENWQDEYYIWDCAAGTGNLLAGLTNAKNIFASTIDRADVDVMQERRQNGANLMESHIFQFDFLNDEFLNKLDEKGNVIIQSKLPEKLQKIISNEPHKLVIFINPPYKEATSSKSISTQNKNLHKPQVATETEIYKRYLHCIGKGNRELFAQFFIRIYKEIPNSILASFSTLKYINATNFIKFRQAFNAKLLKGFICPSWTFDNVKRRFPIGFLVWNLGQKQFIETIKVDIFDANGNRIGQKRFYSNNKKNNIKDWLREFNNQSFVANSHKIGHLVRGSADFQNNNVVFITLKPSQSVINASNENSIFAENLIANSIFLAVRHAIKHTWINNRDQFLYPNKKWLNDSEFHSDCLAFMLFHRQNNISSKDGINHFIPFSEVAVGAKSDFQSDFMLNFINGKIKNGKIKNFIPSQKIAFSKEAKAVFSAGLEIWKYYHKCAKNSDSYLNDASLYDIKEFFQGRNEKGEMNAKSNDSHYNDLIAQLRIALQNLADKIAPKIYEYEFLRE